MPPPTDRDLHAELAHLKRQQARMERRLRALEPPIEGEAYLRELAQRTLAGDRTALDEHTRRMRARMGALEDPTPGGADGHDEHGTGSRGDGGPAAVDGLLRAAGSEGL